jgi:hypothetical protein
VVLLIERAQSGVRAAGGRAPARPAWIPGWWPLPVALVIAFVTWPVGSLTPTAGLDPSWRVALSMIAARGVDSGDIAFTYGPLGFLEAPLNAEPHTLVPALLWTGLLQVGLAYLVIECARRTLTWPVAIALAFVSLQLLDEGREVLPVVAFLWAALVVQWGVPARAARVLLPLSGLVCGVGVLVKVNEGVVAIVMAGVAAWWLAPGRWRGLAVLAGSTLATVVVAWVATGNGIAGLPEWVRNSIWVAGGYSAGLPAETPGRGWEYPLFAVLVAGIAFLAWQSGEGLGRARRVGMGIAGAMFAFALFKHGFVRHDLGHSASTFAALIPAAAAIRWRGASGRIAGATACAAAVVAAIAVYATGYDRSVWTILDPSPRIERAADHVVLALRPGERGEQREEARRTLRASFGIPGRVRDAIEGRTVHVSPYETSIVWAYGLDWRPLPVFQDYVVYTHDLDLLNADVLRGQDAPERVLRRGEPRIDGHSVEAEGPEQLLAMICGYRQAVALPPWQVLARAPWRCSPERDLGAVTVALGQNAPVPAAPGRDWAVVARVEVPRRITDRLRNVLYRPRRLPEVTLNDGYTYRIPAANLPGPLPVRLPPSVGWADYAGGFQFDLIRIQFAPGPVTIKFSAVRVGGGGGTPAP